MAFDQNFNLQLGKVIPSYPATDLQNLVGNAGSLVLNTSDNTIYWWDPNYVNSSWAGNPGEHWRPITIADADEATELPIVIVDSSLSSSDPQKHTYNSFQDALENEGDKGRIYWFRTVGTYNVDYAQYLTNSGASGLPKGIMIFANQEGLTINFTTDASNILMTIDSWVFNVKTVLTFSTDDFQIYLNRIEGHVDVHAGATNLALFLNEINPTSFEMNYTIDDNNYFDDVQIQEGEMDLDHVRAVKIGVIGDAKAKITKAEAAQLYFGPNKSAVVEINTLTIIKTRVSLNNKHVILLEHNSTFNGDLIIHKLEADPTIGNFSSQAAYYESVLYGHDTSGSNVICYVNIEIDDVDFTNFTVANYGGTGHIPFTNSDDTFNFAGKVKILMPGLLSGEHNPFTSDMIKPLTQDTWANAIANAPFRGNFTDIEIQANVIFDIVDDGAATPTAYTYCALFKEPNDISVASLLHTEGMVVNFNKVTSATITDFNFIIPAYTANMDFDSILVGHINDGSNNVAIDNFNIYLSSTLFSTFRYFRFENGGNSSGAEFDTVYHIKITDSTMDNISNGKVIINSLTASYSEELLTYFMGSHSTSTKTHKFEIGRDNGVAGIFSISNYTFNLTCATGVIDVDLIQANRNNLTVVNFNDITIDSDSRSNVFVHSRWNGTLTDNSSISHTDPNANKYYVFTNTGTGAYDPVSAAALQTVADADNNQSTLIGDITNISTSDVNTIVYGTTGLQEIRKIVQGTDTGNDSTSTTLVSPVGGSVSMAIDHTSGTPEAWFYFAEILVATDPGDTTQGVASLRFQATIGIDGSDSPTVLNQYKETIYDAIGLDNVDVNLSISWNSTDGTMDLNLNIDITDSDNDLSGGNPVFKIVAMQKVIRGY